MQEQSAEFVKNVLLSSTYQGRNRKSLEPLPLDEPYKVEFFAKSLICLSQHLPVPAFSLAIVQMIEEALHGDLAMLSQLACHFLRL